MLDVFYQLNICLITKIPGHPMAKSENSENSRQALIVAAGALFAENGVSGTNVRSIAAKAGVNVALINYHFGNKDGLVNAVIDFVLESYRHYMPNEFIKTHPELWETRTGQRKIVAYMVDQAFEFIRPRPENPWINTFIMRCAEANDIGRRRILAEILIPGCIRYTRTYVRITGSTDYRKARCWALSVFAPAFIYATNPTIIDYTCPGKRADDNFYDELKRWSINVAWHELGLQENGESDYFTALPSFKKKTYLNIAGD